MAESQPEGEKVGVRVGDRVELKLPEPVSEKVGVGPAVMMVLVGAMELLPVTDTVSERVPEAEAEGACVREPVTEAVPQGVGERLGLPEPVGEAPEVGDSVSVCETVAVAQGLGLQVRLTVPVGEAPCDADSEAVGDQVRETEPVGELTGDADGLGDQVWDTEEVGELPKDADCDSVTDSEPEGECDLCSECVGREETEASSLGVMICPAARPALAARRHTARSIRALRRGVSSRPPMTVTVHLLSQVWYSPPLDTLPPLCPRAVTHARSVYDAMTETVSHRRQGGGKNN